MIYFTIFILLIFVVIYLMLERDIINPIIIFCSIWAISLILSSFGLYNMTEISEKAIIIILIGSLSFVVGATIYYIYNSKFKDKIKLNNACEKKYIENVNFNLINIILIVSIILILPLATKVTMFLFKGVNYSEIRAMYYSYGDKESLIKNETLFTIFDWFSAAVLATVTPIIIINTMKKNYKIFSTIALSIFTILYIYSTAGRSQLFIIFIEIVLTYLMFRREINKKIKKGVTIFFIVITIIILVMSIARNNKDKTDSINQGYAYLSLPAPYFSKLVDYIDKENINTNGVATLYGPYLIVQKTIKGLTGYKLQSAEYYFNIINKPQNYWLRIFQDSKNYYNAYATLFYNFYLDFKFIGVIIFSFLYGIFMEIIYLNSKSKKSVTNIFLYLVCIIGLCNSFIRWQFASPTIIFTIILLKIIIQKNKVLQKNEQYEKNKILVFGMTENPGGIESVIMNYYRHINRDNIQFDFLCNSNEVAYEDEIIKLGGKIFKVTPRSSNRFKFAKDMRAFFSKNAQSYSTIWVNVCSLANIDYLKYAKKYGIEKRIIHCHNSQNMDSMIRGLLHQFNKKFLTLYATDFWSCSDEASKWFYTSKILCSNKYKLIKNAIDYKKYSFNSKIRDEYRKNLKIENKIVIGNIGRFHFQKNQLFLLDIFCNLKKLNNNFVLILVGDGEDKKLIEEKIESLNLNDSVILLGIRNDVDNILQAMDAFVFPSKFEGLPMVLMEAQANGLQIFASKNISDEIVMSENFIFISLEENSEKWAKIIYDNYCNNKFIRHNNYEKIIENGYEINNEASKLEKILRGIKNE